MSDKPKNRPGHARRGAAAITSIQTVLAKSMFDRPMTFCNRGFSDRTIKALAKFDIDMPERLIFMDDETIRSIPGIGTAGLTEIVAYRERFIRE